MTQNEKYSNKDKDQLMPHFWWIVVNGCWKCSRMGSLWRHCRRRVLLFCSATLLTGRMIQDDEFDMVGSENDDNNGRVWTTLWTYLNPLCPEILCWKDGCFCAILYNCTELEIAKKHGDFWGVLMPHFDHGTWRFDRVRSLENAARTIQHGRERVGANYAVTGRASNTKIAWCLDNIII